MAKIGEQIGPYTLEKFLGHGGFGEVWLADNPQDLLYPKVAIKMATRDETTLEMIKAEALLWRKVSGHENIVPFIEAKNYDGQIIIVSEFADGGSLEDYLKKNGGKLGIQQAESILQDILNGLEHLHNKGIGHFDLKPANILIKEGKFCLADFGLSKALVTTNTSRGTGTPSYSPPELFNKKRCLQSDIWSVGVILHEILTGKLPFEGDSLMGVIFSIIQNEPQPLPNEIPLVYRNLISKCLKKEAKDRFQSSNEMRKALKGLPLKTENPIVQPILPKDTIIDKDFSVSIINPFSPETFTNSIGMEFVKIPSGSFMMGSPTSESGRDSDEGPPQRVRINYDFYLGKYEVTQEQYQAVMRTNPSYFKNCPKCPVDSISWNDAKEFIKKLNAKNAGYEYRLPSEAEWEYAARAGKDTPFGIGDGSNLSSSQANFNGNYPYGNAPKGPYLEKTAPVGSYQPNEWGLYDMSGNVWEWCEDIYKDSYSGLSADGSANMSVGDLSYRVLRGSSWFNYGFVLRSATANRKRNVPDARNYDDGFRLVARPC